MATSDWARSDPPETTGRLARVAFDQPGAQHAVARLAPASATMPIAICRASVTLAIARFYCGASSADRESGRGSASESAPARSTALTSSAICAFRPSP